MVTPKISCSTVITHGCNSKPTTGQGSPQGECSGSSHLFFLLYNVPIFIPKRGVLIIHRGKQGQQIIEGLMTKASHCCDGLVIVGGQDMAPRADGRRKQGDSWYSPLPYIVISLTDGMILCVPIMGKTRSVSSGFAHFEQQQSCDRELHDVCDAEDSTMVINRVSWKCCRHVSTCRRDTDNVF